MGRDWWRGRAAAFGALALALGTPTPAAAEGARFTFSFRPAAPLTSTTLDIASEGSQWLPSLKLAGDGAPVRIGGWSVPLPGFAVRSVSFVPRYGDHQLALGFQAASLPDVGIPVRRVSGIAVTTKGSRFSSTVIVGRAENGRSLNPIASPIPQLLAASATVTPRKGLTLSPRLVTPLVRGRTQTELAVGSGMRAQISPRLTMTADVGAARARDQWAPSAVAGVSGRWRRAVFEVASGHIAPGATLLGPMPFAGSRRLHSNVRMELTRGVSAEAQMRTLSRLTGRTPQLTDRTLALRIDRLSPGAIQLKMLNAGTAVNGSQGVVLEWRERSSRSIAVQFDQRQERTGPSERTRRQVQIEVPKIPGTGRLTLLVRSSVLLAAAGSSDARSATYVNARFRSGPVGVSEEMWMDAWSARSSLRVGRLVSRIDVRLPIGSTLQVSHEYLGGERISTWRRLQIGVAHTVSR